MIIYIIPTNHECLQILKKPEYFGRYGKIHKCVLNQQGPVATAYATYVRDEVRHFHFHFHFKNIVQIV